MFSGLTNQFTSLVGAVKGGAGDEDVPVPTGGDAAAATTSSTAAEPVATSAEQDAAAAAAGGEGIEGEEGAKSIPKSTSMVDSFVSEATGWLGSAKGWLGNASMPSMPAMAMPSMPSMPAMPSIPSIPGLRKSGAAEGAEGAEGAADASAAGAVSGGDDDDKSRYISATEGADSHPASGGGTPTGDEGQIGQGKGDEVKITTKVTQQAKHFGSFLSSAISKAGSKIKETVKDNTILDSFNKEQEAFIKGQGGAGNGAAPWIGHANESKIKEEILGLSQDRRNFVRAPPAGVDFEFSYDTAYPTAIAIMAEDKALETMRFELVPKIITEENFWRNYFYRVSLIIQAAELGTLGADGVGQASSGEDEEQWEKDLEAELKDYEVVDEGGTGGGRNKNGDGEDEDEDEEPTISNLRTRSSNNDWEEYADLIEDTDDLKTLKCLKRTMLGYQ
ncbi:synapse-associated protein of 47 kDa isoform X10 [Drosophila nasuta]|uniref:synapse-associated protein of 47 kDa isoform X10 n=1 Tax=Drosophila nasuta TaxID=42062 RepID=UPI00295EA48E|nr:synapse-associated protein of 47 kDa isoform X10 [Drosophila nasuta]